MTIKTIFSSVALLLLTIILSPLAQGQGETYSHRLYTSYQLGQMDEWLEVLDQMGNDYRVTPSNEVMFDIIPLASESLFFKKPEEFLIFEFDKKLYKYGTLQAKQK